MNAQLEQAPAIQSKRQHIWTSYNRRLSEWSAEHAVHLPVIPDGCEQAYHLFYMLLPSLEQRQVLMSHRYAQHWFVW